MIVGLLTGHERDQLVHLTCMLLLAPMQARWRKRLRTAIELQCQSASSYMQCAAVLTVRTATCMSMPHVKIIRSMADLVCCKRSNSCWTPYMHSHGYYYTYI